MRRKTKTQLSIRRVKQRKKKKTADLQGQYQRTEKEKKKKPSSKLPILAENKNIREERVLRLQSETIENEKKSKQ